MPIALPLRVRATLPLLVILMFPGSLDASTLRPRMIGKPSGNALKRSPKFGFGKTGQLFQLVGRAATRSVGHGFGLLFAGFDGIRRTYGMPDLADGPIVARPGSAFEPVVRDVPASVLTGVMHGGGMLWLRRCARQEQATALARAIDEWRAGGPEPRGKGVVVGPRMHPRDGQHGIVLWPIGNAVPPRLWHTLTLTAREKSALIRRAIQLSAQGVPTDRLLIQRTPLGPRLRFAYAEQFGRPLAVAGEAVAAEMERLFQRGAPEVTTVRVNPVPTSAIRARIVQRPER